MPDLALHPCAPYTARVTRAGCALRWQRAQRIIARGQSGAGARRGNATQVNAERLRVVLHCQGCAIGERRAGA